MTWPAKWDAVTNRVRHEYFMLAIFAAESDYQFFRDALVEAAHRHGLTIHAYVWITNPIHLLATPAASARSSNLREENTCSSSAHVEEGC